MSGIKTRKKTNSRHIKSKPKSKPKSRNIQTIKNTKNRVIITPRSPSRTMKSIRSPRSPYRLQNKKNKKELGLKDKTNASLLCIFDIDETLIQYIDQDVWDSWKIRTKDVAMEIDPASYVYIDDLEGYVFFRPGLDVLFEKFQRERLASGWRAAIWTYGNRMYCDRIVQLLIDTYHLQKDFFCFALSREDITNHDKPKNISDLFLRTDLDLFTAEERGRFGIYNTLLVDNLTSNICYPDNEANGICIESFEPFHRGEKTEVDWVLSSMEKEKRETIDQLIRVLDWIPSDRMSQEVMIPNQPVFHWERIHRLKQHIESHASDFSLVKVHSEMGVGSKTTDSMQKCCRIRIGEGVS